MSSTTRDKVVVGLASSFATAATVSALFVGYGRLQQSKRRAELSAQANKELPKSRPPPSLLDDPDSLPTPYANDSPLEPRVISGQAFSEDLIKELLARNYAFFGEESMKLVRSAKVVVVGCGGVGSSAAIMLLRSGGSNIRLVDFDNVSLSSLNRHAVATLADVGTPKVQACKKHFAKIAPWANVEALVELWNDTKRGHDILKDADWVIDAIDNITTKVDLLAYCRKNNIKVFASMGAGAKCDPTRVQISDISLTQEDPLARSVRRRLRAKEVFDGIPAVYSTEVPGPVKLLPLPEEEFAKGSVHELGALDDFRIRILPVLGGLPCIFGYQIATFIICELAGKPIPHPLPSKNRWKMYERLGRDLVAREIPMSDDKLPKRLPISDADIGFIFEDLHRARSTIPPHPVLSKPMLSRWDSRQPLSVENCIVLSAADIRVLDAAGGIGENVQWWNEHEGNEKAIPGSKVIEVVERRRVEAREYIERL